jgi:hypothetical protein
LSFLHGGGLGDPDAAAAISTAIAIANTSIGAWRRQPGWRGVTESVSAGATNDSAARARRRCWPTYHQISAGIATSPSSTNGEEKVTGGRTAAPPAWPAY